MCNFHELLFIKSTISTAYFNFKPQSIKEQNMTLKKKC